MVQITIISYYTAFMAIFFLILTFQLVLDDFDHKIGMNIFIFGLPKYYEC